MRTNKQTGNNGLLLRILAGILCLIPIIAYAYSPPDYTRTFYGDATGDMLRQVDDIPTHKQYAASGAASYNSTQPQVATQYWNTCDMTGDNLCQVDDIPSLKQVASGNTISIVLASWEIVNWNLPLASNMAESFIPFRLNARATGATVVGRPGIIMKVTIDPNGSTTTGKLQGRSCSSGDLHEAGATCAIAVSVTDMANSANSVGLTESASSLTLAVQAYGSGTLHLHVETTAQPPLQIPAMTLDLYPEFGCPPEGCGIYVDCSNPGPNPVSELTTMQCAVTAPSAPEVDADNDTCGGSVSGSGPWTYDFTPTEAQGPGSCVAAVELVSDASVKDSDHTIINEVNVAPVDNATSSVSGTVLNPISFNINPTDSDIPAQTLTCSIVSNSCPGGTLTNCEWSWTPATIDGPTSCNVVTQVYDGVTYSSNKTTKVIVTDGGDTAPTNNAPATVTGNEKTSISFSANPTDPESPPQTLTSYIVSATGACTKGTLSGNTWSWTPSEADGPTSCDMVTVVFDGSLYSANVTTHIVVLEVNVAPVNNRPATVTGDELTVISFSTNPTDADIPAQTLTSYLVSATGACTNGTMSGDTWSWTPTEAKGPTSCNVVTRVYDGMVYSSNRTTRVVVNEVNVAPDDNATTSVSGTVLNPISFGINPTDSDIPAQTLTCSVVSNSCPGGTLTSCAWSWTPATIDGPTSCDVVTRAYDGIIYSSNKTTKVIVTNGGNTAPVDNAPANVTGDELTAISFNVNPTDGDVPAQTLTCSQVSNGCAGGALVGCAWSWTPTEAQGPASCNVVTRAYDGVAYSSNVTTHIKVNEVNGAPVDNAPANVTGDELTAISFNVNPTDGDVPAQTLTCSQVSNGCAGGALVGCAWSWTPTEAQGPASCDVVTRAYDGVAYSSNVTTHIIVNEVNGAPVDNAPANVTGDELTVISFNVNPTDGDVPAQTLTCSQVSNGCAGGALVGCAWSWTPTEIQGPASCNVVTVVYDGSQYSSNVTTHIVVLEVNVAPANHPPTTLTGDELTSISFSTNPTDADRPKQTLTSYIVSATGACSNGTMLDNTWSWTPTEADGPTSCNVVTRAYDTIVYSANKTTHIIVNEVNGAPVDNAPANVTGDELTAIGFNVNPTDGDVPAQTLTCSQVSNGCAGGALVGCAWSWTPTEAQGPASCDVVTNAYDGVAYSSNVTTHIKVNEVNGAPVDNAPAILTGDEATEISFNVNPTDADIPTQSLTCSLVSVNGACASGALVGCAWSWTPTEADGPTSCDVETRVYDGVAYSPSWITHVVVEEVNNPPVDNAPANASGNELSSISFSVSPTDGDVPVQGLVCSVVSATGACVGGSMTSCNWSWTPTEAQGPTSCDVVTRAFDGVDYSVNKTTHITVNEVNQNPTWTTAPLDVTVDAAQTYNQTNGVAADGDLPNSGAGTPGYLQCSASGNTCSFSITASGAGSGAANCNMSFTAGSTGETCHVTVAASDGWSPAGTVSKVVNITVINTPVTIDCSTPGPNPVNELTAMQCAVTSGGGTPTVDTAVDTCGGTLSGSGPWTYNFTPTEAKGPGTCKAAVKRGTQTANQVVTVNEVNQTPTWTTAPANLTAPLSTAYSETNGQATDADLPNAGVGDPGYLTCTRISNSCSFAVTVSGSGAGAVGCATSFTTGTKAETCSVNYQVTDEYGATITQSVTIAVGRVRYVNVAATGSNNGSSWANAYTAIQAAVSASKSGEWVWVTQGTYSTTSTSYIVTMKTGVDVYGGFVGTENELTQRGDPATHPTVIDGTNSKIHCVIGASTSRLDGFTIKSGNANTSSNNSYGGGVFNVNVTDFTLANCIVRSNNSKNYGGGMYNNGSTVTVTNCIFFLNTSGWGGAIFNYTATATITNCIFDLNTASNDGGAIFNYSNSNPTIKNCRFASNTATGTGNTNGGSAIFNQTTPVTVINCLFINNMYTGIAATDGGGAIHNYQVPSTGIIVNCTFNGNSSASNGGAIFNDSTSALAITNNILWDDIAVTGNEIANETGSTPSVNYNDVDGGYSGGTGNIDSDPLFEGYPLDVGTWTSAASYSATYARSTLTDSAQAWIPGELVGLYVNPDTAQTKKYLILANTATTLTVLSDVTGFVASGDTYEIFDYHMTSGSPCKNTGTSTGAPTDDLDGYPRPIGAGYDMGAYEYQIP